MIPEIVGTRVYHHIPASRRFGGMADDCFYFTSDNTKVTVISSPFRDLCGDFTPNIARTMGPSVWSRLREDLKCTHRRSSLSVFKCCLALLILSGKPGAQIQQKQLYFNVTGIRFAEERILKWA